MLFGKHVNMYYLKYIHLFIIGMFALIVVDYYQLLLPEIYGMIIDDLTSITSNSLGEAILSHEEFLGNLNIYMLEFLKIAVIMFVGRFLWRYTVFGAAIKIESDLRLKMFNHSLQLDQDFYQQHKTGAMMALFTNDLQKVRECFGDGFLMLVDALFLGAFSFYKMYNLDPVLSLICLIPFGLILIVSTSVGKIMTKRFEAKQEAFEELSDFTQENFSGISVIKAFVKETKEIKEFNKINKKNGETHIRFIRFSLFVEIMVGFILSLVVIIILGGGGYLVYQTSLGNGDFSVGNLQEFVVYFSTLTWPMMAIANLIYMTTQGYASLNRINKFLNHEIVIVNKDDSISKEVEGSIEFKNLNFNYPDENRVILHDISFKIPAGYHVGIIGKTGSGKSTVVDLLLRLYNLNDGELLIDGIDIMNYDYSSIRKSIGYVPQDNFLFSDTIANNIGFAFDEVDEQVVQDIAKLADVHDNIIDFEDKYQTILGERGVRLSGGQKQRVSIARALVKDPKILIFDDSLSAVDTKTEEKILSNIKKIRQDKTTILIAHRISTVKDLDMIIVLDNGHVDAIGTHEELLNNSTIYKDIVNLQKLEKEVNGGDHNE